jgi:hypothetical protein
MIMIDCNPVYNDYIFKNNVTTYKCRITVVGENNEPTDVFIILKNEKEILNEAALKINGE